MNRAWTPVAVLLVVVSFALGAVVHLSTSASATSPPICVNPSPGSAGIPEAFTITGVTPAETGLSIAFTIPMSSAAPQYIRVILNGVDSVASGVTSPLTVTGLTPGTDYSVVICGGAPGGDGDASNAVTTRTLGTAPGPAPEPVRPPAVPTVSILEVTSTGFRYALSSQGSLDAYYLHVGDRDVLAMNPNAASGVIDGLTPDTTYEISAWATRGELTSDRATSTVRTQSVPQPVSGLTVTQESGLRAVATWSPPPGTTPVMYYRVRMFAGSTSLPCVSRTGMLVTTCASPSLRVGDNVVVSVTPVGEFGDGPSMSASVVIAPERPAPPQILLSPAKRGLFVTVRPTDVGGVTDVTTSATIEVPKGAGGVERAERPDSRDASAKLERSSTCPGLVSLDGCYFVSLRGTTTRDLVIEARVKTAGGTSDRTRVAAFLIDDEDVLPAPTNVVAKPGDEWVTVTWDAPITSAPVRGYEVLDAAGTQVCEVDALSPGCSFATVDGVRQSYRVRAFNASGDGGLSAPTAVVASGVPTTPGITSAERLTSTTARITWSPSTPIGSAGVTEYVIRSADDTVLCRVPASESTCDVVVPATPVLLRIAAVSDAGPSSPALVNLARPLLPPPPSGLRFSVEAPAGGGAAVLVAQWNAVTGDPSPTSYRVVAQGDAAVGCTAPAPATRCTVAGVTPGSMTTFTVASGVNGQYGKESEPVSAALDKPSSAGLRRAIQSGATSIEATWKAPEGSPSIDRIEARIPSGQSCTSVTGSLTCTITGVPPKTKQRVEMRAINAFGATEWRTRTNLLNDFWGERLPSGNDEVWMRTQPEAPDRVWVGYQDGELTASWNSEDLFKIRERDLRWDRQVGYRVYLVSNPSIGGFWAPASGAEPTEEQVCIDRWSSCEVDVPNDVPYLFRIVAYNEWGESESAYSPLSMATRDRAAPGAPSAVKVTRTGLDTVRISWTAPPRSAWGSNLPPEYSVRLGEANFACETYQTSCTVGTEQNWRYPILWGWYQEGELPVSVVASNNAGDSAPVTAVVPAYGP